MAFNYDLSTARGKVRLLVPDRVSTDYLFQDDEIDAFLSVEDSSVKRGAALALETIASDIAMIDKVIKLLDLQTDGAKTSDALIKRAATLRDQADNEDITDHFDYIEFSDLTEWNTEEWIAKNVSW